ncbi:hypothetical protein GCM10010149_76000 [Nonomuraea roseoviolacea subsp. roseoviolacea]|uniref:MarR family winged helix-turn-helix transcriptional regulator n=1 Tax=Nonomuraea roseoviolacea TaxID=103837 RepID=UPI0031D2EAB7
MSTWSRSAGLLRPRLRAPGRRSAADQRDRGEDAARQPHVTRQVQQLERRGLVRRIGDPNDRRVSYIEPTDKGRAAADRYARTLIGWFTGAISHWSARDREDLGRLLARFADDVTAHLATLDDT